MADMLPRHRALIDRLTTRPPGTVSTAPDDGVEGRTRSWRDRLLRLRDESLWLWGGLAAAIALSLVDAANVGTRGPFAKRGTPRSGDVIFQVLTAAGKPVAGAKVTLHGFQGAGATGEQFSIDGEGFPADDVLFPSATTDAKGFVTFSLPDDKALTSAGCSPERVRHVRATFSETDLIVHMKIDHPDHPRWSGIVRVDKPAPVMLPASATLTITAHREGDEASARRLYPVLSRPQDGIDWLEEDGVLTIRRVDLTSPRPSRWLRIVHVPAEGPAWFSELIDLQLQQGLNVALNVTLRPSVRIAGRLSENVPRPVANGWVAGLVDDGCVWMVATEIARDGTFALESLPADEDLQLVACSDGWVSRALSSAEVSAYARRHSFAAGDYDKWLRSRPEAVYPRLYRLESPVTEAVIPMAETSAAQILVVDEQGTPIADTQVAFLPHVLWFGGGVRAFMPGIDRLSLMRAELASGERANEDTFRPGHTRYAARTNAQGVATIRELPTGARIKAGRSGSVNFRVEHENYTSAGPSPGPEGFNSTVRLVPGQTARATVRMRQK